MHRTLRVSAALLLLATATAWSQGLQLQPPGSVSGRLWLDNAYTLGRMQANVNWDHRQASKGGRKLNDYDTGAEFGLTDDLTIAWDTHSLHAANADKTTTFDATAWGLKVKYGIDAWSSARARTAVALEWRHAEATSVSGEATRTPPDAQMWALTAYHSRELGPRSALHLGGGLTETSLGSANCLTLQLGGGCDWRLGDDVAIQGTLSAWHDSGDATSTYAGLMGRVLYENDKGFGASAGVAFFPSGVPVAGTPLADGTAFALDPVAISLAQHLRNDALGVLEVGVHYSHQF